MVHHKTQDASVWSKDFAWLALSALAVVFGDLGTSSLYSLKEAFAHQAGMAATPAVVFGILSMVVWSLTLIISVKYVMLVMRADNHGEGGIMALLSLLKPTPADATCPRLVRMRPTLILLALAGTALLYGDGVITPAISVLSAVEGLEVASPMFRPYILPIAVGLLIGLFSIQSRGTGSVGRLFGPIVLLWFVAQAALGLHGIAMNPSVLSAVNPIWALRFIVEDPSHAFVVLGSVFLVVTGGEALYADMGHFGRRPIRLLWFGVVMPAMLLNYFGQGALLLMRPEATSNPFFQLAPSWAVIPLVLLATAATLIASQALITAVFSMTAQAQALGYLPRMRIVHTAASASAQIYVPVANWLLMIATIVVVLGFKTSASLAAAYGIAVTGTMIITTMLWAAVARYRWHWSKPAVVAIVLPLVVLEGVFLASNALKIADGGWLPLVIAGVMFTVMTTWFRGRTLVAADLARPGYTLTDFIESVRTGDVPRTPDTTGVFLYGYADDGVPAHLLHYLKHVRSLPKRLVVLTIQTAPVPYVSNLDMLQIQELGGGVVRVIARLGFMQRIQMPRILELLKGQHITIAPDRATFFLGRESIVATAKPGMAPWREQLFVFLTRNARTAPQHFGIPASRIVELGVQVEI